METINYLPVNNNNQASLEERKLIWQYINPLTGDWIEAETDRDSYCPPITPDISQIHGKTPKDGLFFQGWNISEEQLIEKYYESPIVTIGAYYIHPYNKTYALLKINNTTTLENTVTIAKSMPLSPLTMRVFDINWNQVGEDFVSGITSSVIFNVAFPTDGLYWLEFEGKDYALGNEKLNWSFLGDNISQRKSALQGLFLSGLNVKALRNACDGCKSLKSVVLSVETGFNVETFKNCTSLNQITINTPLLLYNSFLGCRNLVNITIPPNITVLGDYAFASCINIKNFTMPYGLTGLGVGCLSSCSSIKNITLPSSIRTLPDAFIRSAYSLVNMVLPNTITSIITNAFLECSNLQIKQLPPNLKNLGVSSLNGCAKLSHLVLPNTLTAINANTFNNCTTLESIYIPNTIIQIGASAFNNCPKLGLFDFTQFQSIPNLLGTWSANLTHSMLIVVPDSLLAEWRASTNWSLIEGSIIDKTTYNTNFGGNL